ncbi:MAG: hypothetical protein AB1345_00415 [Chloroflexota bacterium]
MNTETAPLCCVYHPKQQTLLRCNRCEQPICSQCAVLTPTGYRCKECINRQQKSFDTARWYDFPLSILIAASLSYVGSLIASRLGWFTIFIAPTAGIITAEAIRFTVRKRRSKTLFRLSTIAVFLGGLPILAITLLTGNLWGFLWPSVYALLVSSSVYYRLIGIKL